MSELKLAVVLSEPFMENTYLAWRPGGNDCLVFDPGLEPDKIFAALEQRGLEPALIIDTHGHADHIGGNAAMKERWPDCPLLIGRGDAPMLTDPWLNLSAQYGTQIVSPEADRLLDEGERVEAAGFSLEVRDIPGHSPGHIVLVDHDTSPVHVFGGDVLFAGSIGRTDFPGGSLVQLLTGIRDKLYTLADDTVVLPGHGPETTVGQERATNPFTRRM